jgi:hypothetical protein
LASGQWNDDALLLRNTELQSISKKKKRIKLQTSVESEKKRQPDSIQENKKTDLTDVTLENKEKVEPKNANSSIDLWSGYRKINQNSKFTYRNIIGESPIIGVKASVFVTDWVWYLYYDTGVSYQNAKNEQMRIRDENLQIGFLKKRLELPFGIDCGVSYFENQIVNENNKTNYVGNKKNGLSLLIQKIQNLDKSTDLIYGLEMSPLINYRDTGNQDLNFSGKFKSALTNIISFGLIEKMSDGNAFYVNFKSSWTKVAFKGATSVVEPLTSELLQDLKVNESSFDVQIGFRWNN